MENYDFSAVSRRKEAAAADQEMKKSSYMIPAGLQKRLKMLAAERDVKLNDLLIEAVVDLLRKYGRK